MKVQCKYCVRQIDTRGMPSHIHFRHLMSVLIEFRMNPLVAYYTEIWPPEFLQKQLPASCDPEVGR